MKVCILGLQKSKPHDRTNKLKVDRALVKIKMQSEIAKMNVIGCTERRPNKSEEPTIFSHVTMWALLLLYLWSGTLCSLHTLRPSSPWYHMDMNMYHIIKTIKFILKEEESWKIARLVVPFQVESGPHISGTLYVRS
jgi:hypothetical protein